MKTQVVQLGLVRLIQIGVLSDNEFVCSFEVLEYKIWVKLLGSIQAHADEKVQFVAKIHLNFNFRLSSFSQPFV